MAAAEFPVDWFTELHCAFFVGRVAIMVWKGDQAMVGVTHKEDVLSLCITLLRNECYFLS